MRIPIEALHPDTLQAVIEEYVSREGTDYGLSKPSLAEKVQQVWQRLQKGEAVLCFDQGSETCQILSRDQFLALYRGLEEPRYDSIEESHSPQDL